MHNLCSNQRQDTKLKPDSLADNYLVISLGADTNISSLNICKICKKAYSICLPERCLPICHIYYIEQGIQGQNSSPDIVSIVNIFRVCHSTAILKKVRPSIVIVDFLWHWVTVWLHVTVVPLVSNSACEAWITAMQHGRSTIEVVLTFIATPGTRHAQHPHSGHRFYHALPKGQPGPGPDRWPGLPLLYAANPNPDRCNYKGLQSRRFYYKGICTHLEGETGTHCLPRSLIVPGWLIVSSGRRIE